MNAANLSAPESELIELWHWWTATVKRLSCRHVGFLAEQAEEFRARQHRLAELCQALASAAAETKRPLYQEMDTLVRPWLTADALAKTDRVILGDLSARCQRIERRITRRPPEQPTPWMAILGLSSVVVVVGAFLLMESYGWRVSSVGEALKDAWSQLSFAVARTTLAVRLIAAAIAVVLAAIILVAKSVRV